MKSFLLLTNLLLLVCCLSVNSFPKEDTNPPRPPSFTRRHKMIDFISLPAGHSSTLRCVVDGNPVPKISWHKDGQLLQENKRVRFKKWNLKLYHLTIRDKGVYTCVVWNELGLVNFNFTLEVAERLPHRPILIENYIGNQTVYLGETAVFQCKYISYLHTDLWWIKYYQVNGSYYDEDGLPYAKEVMSTDESKSDHNFLILSNVTYDDAGRYACNVSNIFGVSIQDAWLTVIPQRLPHRPILIENYPGNQTVYLGETAVFQCIYISDFHPALWWIKYYQVNGRYYGEDGLLYAKEVMSTDESYSDRNFLVLSNVTYDDAGRYACNVSNVYGVSIQDAWLTVIPRSLKTQI